MSDEVTFKHLKRLKNDKNVLLIDVREPSELQKIGTVLRSINILLGLLENTLKNTDEQSFHVKYHRDKPNLERLLVFSCQSERTSKAALDHAKEWGYVNAKHYFGGWTEWDQAIKRGK